MAPFAAALDRPGLRVKPFPWFLLRLAAPFNETMRELIEMRAFWEHPVRLDNAALIQALGAEPRTPLADAVRATLAGLDVRSA